MKKCIVIILLLTPIASFSQVNLDWKKVCFPSVAPDSLLNKKVIEQALDLGYIENDTSRFAYDAATFFQTGSFADKSTKMDIYLFSFPTQSVHAPWGIAIRYMDDCFLYHYTHVAAATWKIISLIENRHTMFLPVLSSIYDILRFASDYGTEMKCEKKEDAKYYYNAVDRVRENNDSPTKQKHYPQYSPAITLQLTYDKELMSDKKISQWLCESYGQEYTCNIYSLFSIPNKRLCLIESENDLHKEYDFLFIEKGYYSFFQTKNLFVPLMFILKEFIGEDLEGLAKSVKCLSLCCLYYYS